MLPRNSRGAREAAVSLIGSPLMLPASRSTAAVRHAARANHQASPRLEPERPGKSMKRKRVEAQTRCPRDSEGRSASVVTSRPGAWLLQRLVRSPRRDDRVARQAATGVEGVWARTGVRCRVATPGRALRPSDA